MMAFWVYLLRCADGRYYTGQTDNLERRMGEHTVGGFCDYTSKRRPVELMWSETFQARIEALEAERMVGGWSRAKKEALIRGDWAAVSFHAKPPRERFSTSLETNGGENAESGAVVESAQTPFVSSEVEKPVSSEVEKPVSSEVEKPVPAATSKAVRFERSRETGGKK